ncbi:MAG: hypothetical protein M3414_00520 [Pseudomonadota bacterium]|nr:hypothetical protein [Pseudomonadota bacterium]
MKRSSGLSVLLLVVLAACTGSEPAPPVAQDVPEMPAAISNNAVAIVEDADAEVVEFVLPPLDSVRNYWT